MNFSTPLDEEEPDDTLPFPVSLAFGRNITRILAGGARILNPEKQPPAFKAFDKFFISNKPPPGPKGAHTASLAL